MAGEAAALFAVGEAGEAKADRPFLLAGDQAWYVTSSLIDVFAVRLTHGAPSGARTHLLRAAIGDALFGVPCSATAPSWGLLAVGFQGASVRRLSRARLAASDRPAVDALLERWAQELYAAVVCQAPRGTTFTDLVPGAHIEIPKGGSSRPPAELLWVRHVEGQSRLMGCPGLELGGDGFVPVSRAVWLEATAPSRIWAVSTSDLPTAAERWSGLDRLHDLVLRSIELSEETRERQFVERMARRGVLQQAMLRDACERLVGEISAREAAAAGDRGADACDDPLFAACVLVGGAQGIVMKPYPRTAGDAVSADPLAAILRASRVRSRKVALRGCWWLEDNGPLVGRLVESQQPVALLRPKAVGPYVLVDPITRAGLSVQAAVADTLEPFAYSLYRPFPSHPLRADDVVRFGVCGCGRDLLIVVAMALCVSALATIPALATGVLFNSVIPRAQRPQLLQMTLVLLATAAATTLFNLSQGIALLRIESRAGAAVQSAIWDRLLALPLGFFRSYSSGELAVRAMAIDGVRQVISGSTLSALMGVMMAFGNYLLMFHYSVDMALWATLIIAVLVAVTLIGSVLQLRPQRQATALQSKVSGLVLQLLTGIAKLRVAAAEVPAFALWARRFGEQRRLQYRARDIGNWVTAFNAAVILISYLTIFVLARPLIQERALQTGDFLAFLTAFSAATASMLLASQALLGALNALPLYEQAKPILETLSEVDEAKSDPGTLTGEIEVQHAMFRYHPEGPLVLRDVSLHIRPGEFVALVGPSGSGKSTLLRLLLGFETLEAGTIYFDGQEVGGLDIRAVRRQMGVVLQSGRLMSGDIFTNIVGSSGASLKDAWHAASMAGLAEDIESMPMGMYTVVSEGGGTLSGGQRQRLLIARAIISRPRVLLFDEATSALDNRTQAIVSRSLESLRATRIVVAHRLSTIINADRIFVLEHGCLVQTGSYQQLLREKGPFAELAERQIA